MAAGLASGAIDERADDVIAACCALYDELCPADLSPAARAGRGRGAGGAGRPAGVVPLLAGDRQLRARRPAQARARGDRSWFPEGQGGFGSDAEERERLPPIARERAGGWPRERTVVIGDTPRDIACARADGLRVVAVATGPYGVEALADADAVVDGARERAAGAGGLAGGPWQSCGADAGASSARLA